MNFSDLLLDSFLDVFVLIWDLFLTVGNLLRFSRPVGKVTPKGHPGYGGYWPEYKAPQAGDSRSACPGLNIMANHGILPRNGKDIKFTEVPEHIQATFNFSITFSKNLTHVAARMLKKNVNRDTFDLEEISLHNGIEHDASLTRLDKALQPNQGVTHAPIIEELFSSATGKDAAGNPLLTIKDLSRTLGKRRVECKATNGEYNLDLVHKLFSSANTFMIGSIFGGRVDDLRVILLEERLPQGWESRVRKPYGMTVLTHNTASLGLELSVRESDWTIDNRGVVHPANQPDEERA